MQTFANEEQTQIVSPMAQAKVKLEESKLPSKVLHAIWNLSDVDKDSGKVSVELFRVSWLN